MRKLLVTMISFLLAFCAGMATAQENKPLDLELRTVPATVYQKWSSPHLAEPEIVSSKHQAYYPWAVTGFCFSNHDTGDKPNKYIEKNTCVGLMYQFETKFLWARPLVEVRHIDKNSLNGTTNSVAVGLEWPLYKKAFYLGTGIKVAHIHYEDPGIIRNRPPGSVRGTVALPFIVVGKDRLFLTAEKLGQRAVLFSFGWRF